MFNFFWLLYLSTIAWMIGMIFDLPSPPGEHPEKMPIFAPQSGGEGELVSNRTRIVTDYFDGD